MKKEPVNARKKTKTITKPKTVIDHGLRYLEGHVSILVKIYQFFLQFQIWIWKILIYQ